MSNIFTNWKRLFSNSCIALLCISLILSDLKASEYIPDETISIVIRRYKNILYLADKGNTNELMREVVRFQYLIQDVIEEKINVKEAFRRTQLEMRKAGYEIP